MFIRWPNTRARILEEFNGDKKRFIPHKQLYKELFPNETIFSIDEHPS